MTGEKEGGRHSVMEFTILHESDLLTKGHFFSELLRNEKKQSIKKHASLHTYLTYLWT